MAILTFSVVPSVGSFTSVTELDESGRNSDDRGRTRRTRATDERDRGRYCSGGYGVNGASSLGGRGAALAGADAVSLVSEGVACGGYWVGSAIFCDGAIRC